MKSSVASVVVPLLLLQTAGPVQGYEKNGKRFINWDAHEYPIVPHWNWFRPFPDNGDPPMGFETKCNVVNKFHARNYKLGDLDGAAATDSTHDLHPFADAIERAIGGREYPGSWDGVDHGGQQRDLLMMEWRDLPAAVRKWIETNEMKRPETDDGRRWRFMVFQKKLRKVAMTATETAPLRVVPTEGAERATWTLPKVNDRDKVVFFAPGQLYPLLPLFNAKGHKCEDSFSDLGRYEHAAKDDSVVAWLYEHSKPDPEHSKPDIYFKIRAEHVLESSHGRAHRLNWEKLMRYARRTERKHTRTDREARRGDMDVPDRDEL